MNRGGRPQEEAGSSHEEGGSPGFPPGRRGGTIRPSMKKTTFLGGLLAVVLVLVALAAGFWAFLREVGPTVVAPPEATPSSSEATEEAPSVLYGRVTTPDGDVYEGRLRFGSGEEAFWGDYFNGFKDQNPWAAHAPAERLTEVEPIEIFGFEIASRERQVVLGRPFMSRFGDIVRIEAQGNDVRVTLKSGAAFDLDRLEASDFDDGVRVWDRRRGVVDLDSLGIRSIELLPTAPLAGAPDPLFGTVTTRQGDFTGFLQWNREKGAGDDALVGRTAEGWARARFDVIRSIERRSGDTSLVTLRDGRELVLTGTPEVGEGNRGVYVDDPRYGRVLVSWQAFERVEFSPGGSGPAYGDFPPGKPLTGSVTTRDGRRLAGRLVYDLDESETTETLDAPYGRVHYTLPFGLVASIRLIRQLGPEEREARDVEVTLHEGEALRLERRGDLGEGNAGLLVFAEGQESPTYVPWSDVERIDLHRPPAMYPPL